MFWNPSPLSDETGSLSSIWDCILNFFVQRSLTAALNTSLSQSHSAVWFTFQIQVQILTQFKHSYLKKQFIFVIYMFHWGAHILGEMDHNIKYMYPSISSFYLLPLNSWIHNPEIPLVICNIFLRFLQTVFCPEKICQLLYFIIIWKNLRVQFLQAIL